jgi:hypothetical protein
MVTIVGIPVGLLTLLAFPLAMMVASLLAAFALSDWLLNRGQTALSFGGIATASDWATHHHISVDCSAPWLRDVSCRGAIWLGRFWAGGARASGCGLIAA